MKKVGIDARLYAQTGVGVYIQNLLFYIEKYFPPNITLFVYLLPEDFEKLQFKNKRIIKRKADFRWHGLKEQVQFYFLLQKDNLDLMHFTYFSYPVWYKRKFISTIHDLTPLLFRTGKASTKNPLIYILKFLFFKYVLSSQVKRAVRIITPSQTVRDQILEYYPNTQRQKIVPIYEGIAHKIQQTKSSQRLAAKFKDPFIVYIGNFYPHKNVERLIRAFAKVQHKQAKLILAGPDDFFSKKTEKLIQELQQQKRIVLFRNPDLSDLVFFYKNAKALINPSLSEGFGLPMIEAAHFNLPILGSNIKVFQEILDDSFITFDPYSVSDIKDKIEGFLAKPQKFNYKKILSKYSFSDMTRKTIDIYNQVLSEKI